MNVEYYIIAGCLMAYGFFMPMYCYRKGLKEGHDLAKGKAPEMRSPVKTIQNMVKKDDVEKQKFSRALNNLMAYTGDPQRGE